MKECKDFALYILRQITALLLFILKKSIRGSLWISRHVLKRYFGIETFIYKIWWNNHVRAMQNKLDKQYCK